VICRLLRSLCLAGCGTLICSSVLFSTSAFARASEEKTSPNPCNLSEEETAGLSPDFSANGNALNVYIATASSMLHEERFDQLDCFADQARTNKERFAGGQWKIHELYKGLSNPTPQKHATEDDWHALLLLLRHWVENHPKSLTARVALADAMIGYANVARGSGFADTVSDQGWRLYDERSAEAEKILESTDTMAVRCPEYYIVKMNIAQHQSWSKDRLFALFNQAQAFEPGYYYYGRAMAYFLEPRWFGEAGDTEKFMGETADRIGGEKGDAFYFQVASSSDIVCGCRDQPKLSMERIERGFEAAEKLYGTSMLNLNRMAYLTIYAGNTDIPFGDKVFKRIGTQWDKDTWADQKTFEQTRNWVSQLAPGLAKAKAKEDEARANVKTPEGAQYMTSFEKTYKDLFRECVRSDGATVMLWEGKFDSLIQVGGNGSYEGGGMQLNGPLADCMNRSFASSWRDKSPLFPVPPKPGYVVVMQLDLSEFTPVAAQR
jgi:hypothetical protein